MLNLKNIYKNYLSKKCRILFENNKYSSMHVYANQTSFSAMVLFAKSTKESDIISNYLTQDTVKDYSTLDFVNWCNYHCIDFFFIHPTVISLIRVTISHPTFLISYLYALKNMKASKHYKHF